MISENLVFVQLAQVDDYIGIVELAIALEASVSEVRQRLNPQRCLVGKYFKSEKVYPYLWY